MYVLLIGALCLISFAAGFLTASCYFSVQEKRNREQWSDQRRELQQQLEQSQKLLAQTEARGEVRKMMRSSARANSKPAAQRQTDAVPPKASAAPVQRTERRNPEQERAQLDRIYKAFAPVGSLELRFQYSFPEQLYFVKGEGYLFNARRELIPDRNSFARANNMIDYAKGGMFYVYDVLYRGKEYTFQQIMDGEMGNGYVRISAVIQPARICDAGARDCYALEKRGKVKVVDL